MLRPFVIILIISFLISCNQNGEEKLSNPLVLKDGLLYSDSLSTTPYTGRHKSGMRDMKIEYEVIAGKKEGDFIIYFPNNRINMFGKINNNKNIGEWKYYYSNGSLQTSGYFDNDITTGRWRWFYPKGIIMEEGDFLNGKRDGEWKNYDSTGSLSIIRIYKENKMIDSIKIN